MKLADVVDTHWSKKYKIRVMYAYIERKDYKYYNRIFRNKSLHLEGRAFDLQLIEQPHRHKRSIQRRNVNQRRVKRTLNQKKQRKINKNLPELAGLAYYQADFSFVEVKLHHIHVSCSKSGKIVTF